MKTKEIKYLESINADPLSTIKIKDGDKYVHEIMTAFASSLPPITEGVHWKNCHNHTCKTYKEFGVNDNCITCKWYIDKPHLTPITDEILIEMLKQISEWVSKENQFMPLEYVGLLKEWLSNKSILSHPSDTVEALKEIQALCTKQNILYIAGPTISDIKNIVNKALQNLTEKGTK